MRAPTAKNAKEDRAAFAGVPICSWAPASACAPAKTARTGMDPDSPVAGAEILAKTCAAWAPASSGLSPRARNTRASSLASTSKSGTARLALGSGIDASRSSRWLVTDTHSPAAIDSAPASRPATPVVSTSPGAIPVAATPSTRARLDTSPSLAPKTAARNVPARVSRDLAARERMTSAWMCSSACMWAGTSSSASREERCSARWAIARMKIVPKRWARTAAARVRRGGLGAGRACSPRRASQYSSWRRSASSSARRTARSSPVRLSERSR